MLKDPALIPHTNHHGVSLAGLIIALGIIYGDIGTSPLYVMKAVIGQRVIQPELVLGAISCIFWTITLQTTVKYVLLALNADNNGEGGIFSLYNLIKKRPRGLMIPTILGAAALMADGVITPPISVTSAVEGLSILMPQLSVLPIVMGILLLIFMFQRFGTMVVGKFFGPVMLLWFSLLGILGLAQIWPYPQVLRALSPFYALDLLFNYPNVLPILGAVFLCTTGAEALYSDLGHCGKKNVRISWILVKFCLVCNYLGQGAYLLQHPGEKLTGNPFYLIIPQQFLLPSILIATLAAIIASQALISGSFTLINEAIHHQLWPKVRVSYPGDFKGQLYIPSVNFLLLLGCLGVALFFKESAKMEGAYGLSITLAMLMTTLLLGIYIKEQNFRWVWPLLILFLGVYLPIEVAFLVANLGKFLEGGYVTVVIGLIMILVMGLWLKTNDIKGRLLENVPLDPHIDDLKALSNDQSISKYATHLVYLTKNAVESEIDQNILYSIFEKSPKRADIYWFVHIQVTDEPYTREYHVNVIAAEDVVRLTFYLGFRVEQKMAYFMKLVVQEMIRTKEIDITSRYQSLREKNIVGDFHYIIIENFLSEENALPFKEQVVLDAYFYLKKFTSTRDKWYGLQKDSSTIEEVPLLIRPLMGIKLKRV